MYVCFEANHTEKEHAYLIYSVESYLQSTPNSNFNLEHVIFGVPSMGCGIFGSRIVLAGGLIQDKYGRDIQNKGVITYDIATKQVSTEEIPNMRGGKVKPLVFEINKKLYALDTDVGLHRRSFEIYYPNQKHWHCLHNPYFALSPSLVEELSLSEGLGRFSWFAFGHCLCVSLPMDMLTFLHHSKHRHKVFDSCFNRPLPFQGMAITYYQDGFEDAVVISLSEEGFVQGRRLRLSFDDPYDKPVHIFDTKYYSRHEHKGEMFGFFTNFGNGNFCLVTYDKVGITFYTFHIFRHGKKQSGLSLKTSNVFVHRWTYIQFATEVHTSLRFAGCFTPLSQGGGHGQSKENNEAKLYRRNLRLWKEEEKDDDILGTKCVHNSESEDTDSDGDDMDFELALKREEAYLKLGSSTTLG